MIQLLYLCNCELILACLYCLGILSFVFFVLISFTFYKYNLFAYLLLCEKGVRDVRKERQKCAFITMETTMGSSPRHQQLFQLLLGYGRKCRVSSVAAGFIKHFIPFTCGMRLQSARQICQYHVTSYNIVCILLCLP